MQAQQADIKHIIPVSQNVYRVTFSLFQYVLLLPGQYLKIWFNDSEFRCYSIENTAFFDKEVSVFLECKQSGSIADKLVKTMAISRKARLTLPYGSAYYRPVKNRDIIIIVSGTGYAYGKSITREALKRDYQNKVKLLWFVKEARQIFDIESIKQLQQKYPDNFDWYIVKKDKNHLKNNFLRQLFNNDNNVQQAVDVYVAGSKSWSNTLMESLLRINPAIKNIYGDSIGYSHVENNDYV